MSVDRVDFNTTVNRQQHGFEPSFFPIIIDATTAAVGQELAVNINPCDHVWLPTYYDPSLGLNPVQGSPNKPPSSQAVLTGPNNNHIAGTAANPQGVGMNIFDGWDLGTGEFFQSATIFSLRFNSPNAPWLLWGLSSLLSSDWNLENFLVGQGDSMRSISGPISRMWFKKLAPAIIDQIPTPAADRIVLLASLGFNQLTVGSQAGPWNSGIAGATNTQPQVTSYAVSGGGYQTTQINSVDAQHQREGGLLPPGSLR